MMLKKITLSVLAAAAVWLPGAESKNETVAEKAPSADIRSVESVRIGGVFLPGEKVEIKVQSVKPGLDAVYTITDFFGRKTREGKVDARGMIRFPAPEKNGYYAVKVSAVGKPDEERTGSFIVQAEIKTVDPFFQMCYHYMSDEYIPATRALGYGSMTIPILQYRAEPKRGKYDFSFFDKRLEAAEKQGMQGHGHFTFPGKSSWALPEWQNRTIDGMMKTGYTEEYFETIRNFVHAAAEHYKGKLHSFMLGEEINLSRNLSPYHEDRYLRILQIMHTEIKAVDPNMQVFGLGLALVGYPHYAYLKYILPKALPYLDVVAPDWYNNPPCTYGRRYRLVTEERAHFRQQILDVRKLVKGKRLSIAEKGYRYVTNLPFDHQALKDNAAVAQRGMIITKAYDFIYWVPHYAVTRKDNCATDMGMWLKNNPRPILASTATIARLLANARDAVEIHPFPEIWVYVFRKGDTSIAALWQTSSKPFIETNLTLPRDAVCYDIMGNPVPFEGKLSNYPIFVESTEKRDQLAQRIRECSFKLPPYAAEVQFASDSEIRLVVRNKYGNNLKLKLSIPEADPQEAVIPAETKMKTFRFPLKQAVRSPFSSRFTVIHNGEKQIVPAELNAIPLAKLKNVKLDGTLRSFAGVKPLVMDNSSFLLPYDAAPNGLWTGKKDLSAKVYLGYDEKNFYIGTEVTDDQWFFTQTGSMLWSQDIIQISIDPLNNALSDEMKPRGYDSDDVDIVFGQSAKGPAARCFYHPNKSKHGNRPDLTPVIRFKEKDVMVAEFAIPWKEMGIKPEKGRIFGFNLAVFDREAKDGRCAYSMALSSGTSDAKDPSFYRKFIFTED